MARETKSEKLVKVAAHYYADRITVVKLDPQIRIVNNKLIYSETKGLDYSGVLSNGRHIEFEVKETQTGKLPFNNIRLSQINRIKSLYEMNAEVFLLVYFSTLNRWYRLEAKDLIRLTEDEYPYIPLRYFMGFGFLLSNVDNWPRFLEPVKHPLAQNFIDTYPSWMPGRKNQIKEIKQIVSPDQTDMTARKKRILNAIGRGMKNAEKQNQRVEIFKSINKNKEP